MNPPQRPRLIRGFDVGNLKGPARQGTSEKPDVADAATSLLEISKTEPLELGSSKFMEELASTLLLLEKVCLFLFHLCPSVKKYMGSIRTVLSRSPKRFDHFFVDILSHNLKMYSQTEGVAKVSSPLDVQPEVKEKVSFLLCTFV